MGSRRRNTVAFSFIGLATGCSAILGIHDFAPTTDATSNVDAMALPPGAWLDGFAYRKAITFAAQPDTFAMALVEASDADLVARGVLDPQALTITAADGTTLLPFEIERYTANVGSLVGWVEIPRNEARVYLYYGSPQPQVPTSPWVTCAGVWHMTSLADASPRNLGASSPTPSATPLAAAGLIDGSRQFDGSDDIMNVGDPVDGALDFGTTSFSYSAWVFDPGSLGGYDTALYKGGRDATTSGYDFELGTNAWVGNLSDGTNALPINVGTEVLDTWTYLVVVIDRDAQMLISYRDGLRVTAKPLGALGSVDSAVSLSFGETSNNFRGSLDEVRICRGVRSAATIAAEWATVVSPGSFTHIGVEEGR